MDKQDVVHIHNEILLSHKKKEILPFAAWMDLEGVMRSEISQTEQDKHWMVSLTCEILKVQQTSEYNKRET